MPPEFVISRCRSQRLVMQLEKETGSFAETYSYSRAVLRPRKRNENPARRVENMKPWTELLGERSQKKELAKQFPFQT